MPRTTLPADSPCAQNWVSPGPQRRLRSPLISNSPAKRMVKANHLSRQVAACDLHEAITYLRKWHPDFDILRVEFVDLIEIVSCSPLN